MNDLISRAAALDVLVTSPNFHTTLTRIEELPTIAAIPVEWLKSQNNSTKYYKTVQGQAVELILELWQKEQEAQDGIAEKLGIEPKEG